ncbi:sialidase family protein [Mycovorax composti]
MLRSKYITGLLTLYGLTACMLWRSGLQNKNEYIAPALNIQIQENVSGAAIHTIRLFDYEADHYNSYRIPCLIKATNGTLIAIAEGRKHSVHDYGDIDVVYKLSKDNGNTWSELKVIVSEGEGTWGNPTAVTDEVTGRIWLFLSWNDEHHSQRGGSYLGKTYLPIKEWGQRRVFVTYSDDHGENWAVPIDMTASLLPEKYSWDAMGPGIGIQVKKGDIAGRLIIPAGGRNIYSDDHGLTWKYQLLPRGTFEGTVVELSDGLLMRNDRPLGTEWNKSHTRFIARGTIESGFTDFTGDPNLPDPRCQGSILRYSFVPNIILFLNSSNSGIDKVGNRCMMTVRLSEDDGTTWKYSKLLYPTLDRSLLCTDSVVYGGYSSLMNLTDGKVGALTEVYYYPNKKIAHRRFAIDFHKFDIDWIKQK